MLTETDVLASLVAQVKDAAANRQPCQQPAFDYDHRVQSSNGDRRSGIRGERGGGGDGRPDTL